MTSGQACRSKSRLHGSLPDRSCGGEGEYGDRTTNTRDRHPTGRRSRLSGVSCRGDVGNDSFGSVDLKLNMGLAPGAGGQDEQSTASHSHDARRQCCHHVQNPSDAAIGSASSVKTSDTATILPKSMPSHRNSLVAPLKSTGIYQGWWKGGPSIKGHKPILVEEACERSRAWPPQKGFRLSGYRIPPDRWPEGRLRRISSSLLGLATDVDSTRAMGDKATRNASRHRSIIPVI
ncbi:hypothetical protein ACVJBD_007480 [Rhizobium mongolense]